MALRGFELAESAAKVTRSCVYTTRALASNHRIYQITYQQPPLLKESIFFCTVCVISDCNSLADY